MEEKKELVVRLESRALDRLVEIMEGRPPLPNEYRNISGEEGEQIQRKPGIQEEWGSLSFGEQEQIRKMLLVFDRMSVSGQRVTQTLLTQSPSSRPQLPREGTRSSAPEDLTRTVSDIIGNPVATEVLTMFRSWVENSRKEEK